MLLLCSNSYLHCLIVLVKSTLYSNCSQPNSIHFLKCQSCQLNLPKFNLFPDLRSLLKLFATF